MSFVRPVIISRWRYLWCTVLYLEVKVVSGRLIIFARQHAHSEGIILRSFTALFFFFAPPRSIVELVTPTFPFLFTQLKLLWVRIRARRHTFFFVISPVAEWMCYNIEPENIMCAKADESRWCIINSVWSVPNKPSNHETCRRQQPTRGGGGMILVWPTDCPDGQKSIESCLRGDLLSLLFLTRRCSPLPDGFYLLAWRVFYNNYIIQYHSQGWFYFVRPCTYPKHHSLPRPE